MFRAILLLPGYPIIHCFQQLSVNYSYVDIPAASTATERSIVTILI